MYNKWHIFLLNDILLIIKVCSDGLILRFTVKPYVLLKNLFHWSFSNFYNVKHGHDFFWPQRSWRLLEAKNTPQRPKMAWMSWFIEKSYLWKLLSNLKNPLRRSKDRYMSNIRGHWIRLYLGMYLLLLLLNQTYQFVDTRSKVAMNTDLSYALR